MSNIINQYKRFDARQYERMWFNRIGGFIFGLIVCAFIFFALGCAQTKCVCPTTDVIVSGDVGGDPAIFKIPKGTFDNPDNYWTEDEFEEDLKKFMRESIEL